MGDILSVYTRLVLRYARGAFVARYETVVSVVASDAAPPSADAPLPTANRFTSLGGQPIPPKAKGCENVSSALASQGDGRIQADMIARGLLLGCLERPLP